MLSSGNANGELWCIHDCVEETIQTAWKNHTLGLISHISVLYGDFFWVWGKNEPKSQSKNLNSLKFQWESIPNWSFPFLKGNFYMEFFPQWNFKDFEFSNVSLGN